MRQSQETEQSNLLAGSYHQIKYIQKEPKDVGPISEGDMIIRHNPLLPQLKHMLSSMNPGPILSCWKDVDAY